MEAHTSRPKDRHLAQLDSIFKKSSWLEKTGLRHLKRHLGQDDKISEASD